MRNGHMYVSTASPSATFTADQVVVAAALNGQPYVLPSYSQTINLATTGAGGMDTGTAPASGYVALYAIYNPTTGTASILATNATSSAAPTIYAGGNMPSGYTASALISAWPANASKQFVPANQEDRSIKRVGVTAFSTTTQEASLTSFSVTNAVPPNAKTCSGTISLANSNASTGNTVNVASDSNGCGQSTFELYIATATGVGSTTLADIQFITPQTLYYSMSTNAGTLSFGLGISGYTF
jgi:hypothetical protein